MRFEKGSTVRISTTGYYQFWIAYFSLSLYGYGNDWWTAAMDLDNQAKRKGFITAFDYNAGVWGVLAKG